LVRRDPRADGARADPNPAWPAHRQRIDFGGSRHCGGGEMSPTGFEELAKVLQMSLSPVALISGVGLLLISMNSRIARAIDRARAISDEPAPAGDVERQQQKVQIEILYCRAVMLRRSITLAVLSILLAAVVALCLFAMYYFEIGLRAVVTTLWGAAIACLVVSLIFLIHDVTLTLRALKLHLEDRKQAPTRCEPRLGPRPDRPE
jgi:hypothetical protein